MYTFQQLNNALTNCTSYFARKQYDHSEECTMYTLHDGCGDQDGDPFYDLEDLELYVLNNDEVNDYLVRQYA